MIVTIYDPASGRIASVLEVSDPEAALQNIPDGMLAIEGNFHPDDFYIDADDEPVAIPDRPGEWAMFDYATKAWIDPRPPIDPAAALTARRAAAQLPKSRLVVELMDCEILTSDEVAELGSGRMPPRIAALLDVLSPDARAVALARWGLETVIGRTHPVVVTAALGLGVDDATLDQIFGVK